MRQVPRLKRMANLEFVRRFSGLIGIGPVLVSGGAASILVVAAFGFATGMPLAYLLVGFVVWMLGNHVLEVVEHRALGGAGWPVLSLETFRSARSQLGLVPTLLAGLVLAACARLVAVGAPRASSAVALFAVSAAPAFVALLAVTRSPKRALDPRNLALAAAGLGLDYLLSVLAVAAAAALAAGALRDRGFIANFAAAYAVLAAAFVIGSVVYTRRLALGVHAPRSPEARLAAELERVRRARRTALDHAYGLAAHGNRGGALRYLEAHAATEPDPLAARLELFRDVARWEDPGAGLELGPKLASDLGAAGRTAEAAKVLVVCRYLEDRAQ